MTEEEFSAIVKSTKGIVLSAIRRHLAPRFSYAIDDVAQETYIRAYRGLARNAFRGNSSLNTWLYSIARNESNRMMKKLIREDTKVEKAAQNITPEFDESPESLYEITEMKRLIDLLPEKYRKVLNLFASGLTESEIAEELAISRGTVKSRAFRGRELIRRQLRRYADD